MNTISIVAHVTCVVEIKLLLTSKCIDRIIIYMGRSS